MRGMRSSVDALATIVTAVTVSHVLSRFGMGLTCALASPEAKRITHTKTPQTKLFTLISCVSVAFRSTAGQDFGDRRATRATRAGPYRSRGSPVPRVGGGTVTYAWFGTFTAVVRMPGPAGAPPENCA